MTTLEGDLGPLVAADRTSDNRFAGSGVSPVICRLGPESLLQHPRKGRPLCNTLWLDSGIAHRRVCVQGYASRSLATTHAFANHHLFQGFATGFHGTASNCSCTHHAAFLGWRDGLALRRQADQCTAILRLRRHLPAPPSLPGTPWRRRIVPASGATQFSQGWQAGRP